MQHKVVTLALALEMLALPKDLGLNPATGGLGGLPWAQLHTVTATMPTHINTTHTRAQAHTHAHMRAPVVGTGGPPGQPGSLL